MATKSTPQQYTKRIEAIKQASAVDYIAEARKLAREIADALRAEKDPARCAMLWKAKEEADALAAELQRRRRMAIGQAVAAKRRKDEAQKTAGG